MRHLLMTVVICFVFSTSARGQSVALTEEMKTELACWTEKMVVWLRWADDHYNDAVAPNGKRIKIHYQPVEPAWLPRVCSSDPMNELAPEVWKACVLLKAAPGESFMEFRQVKVNKLLEKVEDRSKWLSRIHVDVGWLEAGYRKFQAQEHPVYRTMGVVGAHFSPFELGRLQIMGLPGFMLQRDEYGRWGASWTWGVSIRLFDVPLAPDLDASVHANIAKVFLHGKFGKGVSATQGGKDMLGFSVTFK